MQQFFNNRYVQLAGLTVGISVLFFAVIWLASTLLGLKDFPVMLQFVLALLGAGAVVYKFFSNRIF